MKPAILVILTAACIQTAFAAACPSVPSATSTPVAWDKTGNSMLSGANGATYFFRYIQYTVGDQYGDLSRAVALYQSITFNSDGTYTIKGSEMDSNTGQTTPCSFTGSGTFAISSSGFGYLTNPLYPGDQIWGMVSKNGVFVGSTTETQNAYNDLFIGAPAATTPATDSTLKGAYSIAYMNFPDGYVANVVTAGLQMTANGDGSIASGTVEILAFQGDNAGISVPENMSYSFSGGIGTLNFPNYYGAPIMGPESLYITQDGTFMFGGSNT